MQLYSKNQSTIQVHITICKFQKADIIHLQNGPFCVSMGCKTLLSYLHTHYIW